MPVELRKRKAAAPAPVPEKPVKTARGAAKAAKDAAKAVKEKVASAVAGVADATEKVAQPVDETNGGSPPPPDAASKPSSAKPTVGQVLSLHGFGGTLHTNDGNETSLKALVDQSKAGVCLFTYPKANTPGCTKQACLFRDSYEPLTAKGLAVYGLSGDSPKANTSFREKQKLPFPLLCDPGLGLVSALGLKKTPKSTVRGVFVIDKAGKVLAIEPGSPDGTLAVAKRVADELAPSSSAPSPEVAGANAAPTQADDVKMTDVVSDEPKAGVNSGEDKSNEVTADGANGAVEAAEKAGSVDETKA